MVEIGDGVLQWLALEYGPGALLFIQSDVAYVL
jgi:hypothetical protein